ncbi:hypothetical protein HMPREF3202_01905 [Prevotella bivia]|uniref:Uncharacterized protein n=1 Tax=Prevotella bivia TaxID=28125 RepID=A0A137SS37_9BACT|nr:hypothetical protein HMPREF3202_01905 [Prevotella bivia]
MIIVVFIPCLRSRENFSNKGKNLYHYTFENEAFFIFLSQL